MELLVETSRHTCIIACSHQMFLVCFSQVLIFQGQQPLMELQEWQPVSVSIGNPIGGRNIPNL